MVEHPEELEEIEEQENAKKKKVNIPLFIVGALFFVGSIVGTSIWIGNIINRQSTASQTASANPHASFTIAKEKQTLKKDGSYWDFHTEGNVINDGNVTLAYVMITVDLFDADGVKVDYGLHNTGRLEVGQTARWTVNAYLDVKPATYNVHIDWLRQY